LILEKNMRASFIIAMFLGLIQFASAQLYKGDKSKVRFFSDAVLEDIEAVTSKAGAVLNATSGEVAVVIPIKSFEFTKSLMREHFNDNYMESDKFPLATFKGKISEPLPREIKKEQMFNIVGTLNIHGVTQERTILLVLKPGPSGAILASGKFLVKLEDHKVKIPTLVFQNIAEVVEVSFELTLNETAK